MRRPTRRARSRARLWAAHCGLVAVTLVAHAGCGPSAGGSESVFATDQLAAESFCPVVWDFVTSVGALFNAAASDVGDIDATDERRRRWLDALDDIDHETRLLVDRTAVWADDAMIGVLVDQIERDVPLAIAVLDDIRNLFTEYPEIDAQRHQERTQQVIVRLEKVIDLPKPDLAAFDGDDPLVLAFRAEPSCQHSVRGADDGRPRANG